MTVPWKTIAQAWNYFQSKVVSPSAPQIQKDEMRKAFFAGASSCFDLIMSFTEFPNAVSELKMTELHREFENYAKMLKAGIESQERINFAQKGRTPNKH